MRNKRVLAMLVLGGVAVLAAVAVKQARQVSTSLAAGAGDARDRDESPGPTADLPRSAARTSTTVRFLANPKPVPTFTVQDLDDRPISSADWRGKTTVVNFWATWCVPCLQEIPDFIALQEKYPDQVQFIGFSMDEGPADQVEQFVAEHKVTYPVAIADDEVAAQFGGVFGLPTSFIVDAEGRLVQRHIGLVSPAIYEQEIRALAGLSLDTAVRNRD
ncbi:MAG: TlpA family protein disulfide reductase [Vicinamibacteraceae bacterium]